MENKLPRADGPLPNTPAIAIETTASTLSPGSSSLADNDFNTDAEVLIQLTQAERILEKVTLNGRKKLARRDNAIAFAEVGKILCEARKRIQHGRYHLLLSRFNISPETAKSAVRIYSALETIDNKDRFFHLGTSKLVELTLIKHRDALLRLDGHGELGNETLKSLVKMKLGEFRLFIKTLSEPGAYHSKSADSPASSADHLQPGDRVESLHARRPGAVVKIYADESGCVCWDDGEPQEAGLGHERMPRNLLVKVADFPAPAKCDFKVVFGTPADTTTADVNEGEFDPAAAPEDSAAHPASGKRVTKAADRDGAGLHLERDVIGNTATAFNDSQGEAEQADMASLRRVDAMLHVHWAGRVFDVAGAGVCVGDTVACTAAESGLFVQVRRPGNDGPAYMAPMVRPVEAPPRSAPPDPALIRRKQYLLDRMKVTLRYADGPELNDIEDLLEELINDISRGRYVPGLVAADYELTRKYWIEGSAK